jgi:iron complex transport system permease protein
MNKRSYLTLVITLIIALIMLSILSLMIGSSGFSHHLWITTHEGGFHILQYRFCRIMLAIIAGSSLAASGASLQALFRNPLADPHLFGISGGAALGASIAIAFFASDLMPSTGAIIGGLCAFLLVFFYLQTSQNGPLSHCLLVGILINSLAAALITLIKTMLPAHKTQSLLFWLVGSITVVEPSHFLIIVPLWLIGILSLWFIKGELEILSFGIEETRLLGIDADKIVKIAIVANCILVGNVVAFCGMIGFLGLVAPHFIRMLVDANLRTLLPIASFVGALLLVGFDTLSRLSFFLWQSEVPVGAISALILSPVFFFLLMKDGRHD